jgi:hypothetical protein
MTPPLDETDIVMALFGEGNPTMLRARFDEKGWYASSAG